MMPARAAPDREVLLETLRYGFDVASWHGPNLSSVLRGVYAPLAARRLPGRKCIWEQALHAAYWKQRVLNKVVGTTPFPRSGSNWVAMPPQQTDSTWKADVQLLREIHTRLMTGVADLSEANLRDAKLRRMIIGAAFHDIYHAGQIALLRKLLRDKGS